MISINATTLRQKELSDTDIWHYFAERRNFANTSHSVRTVKELLDLVPEEFVFK